MSNNEAPPTGGGGDVLDQILATAQAGLSGGGLPQDSGIIGGHWGGTAEPWQGVPYRMPETNDNLVEPYKDGDEFAILRNMNTEQLARFQDTLVATGLVREVIPGRLDDSTIKGMTTLMALGNRQADTWQNMLTGIERAGGLDGGTASRAQEFDTPTYLAPDYATLAQDVKSLFRQNLGRDPDQAEMAQLTAELEGWHKGAFDARVGAQRQDFDNAQADGEQSGGTVRQVDPLSRFQEAFESRYTNELDFVEDKQEAVETRETVEQATGTLSAMSRGA